MFKGWVGEKKTQFNLWLSLDAKLYQRFHDVIIPSKHGTTQIDHILVSPFGIFIVETKNYKGWIYGSESQSTWTQVIYRSKHSFQNPLRQTHRHKKVLSKYLGISESHIQPVISFVGDVQFKTELPSNVLSSGVGSYIKQFRDSVFSDSEVERISGLLSNVKSEVRISKDEHIKSLHDRFASDTVCPKCGSNLVMRTVKQGSRKGSQFLGCTSYPRCRFTKDLQKGNKNNWTIITIILILILVIILII
jgi:predicted RNA-binding Zn-ribbon protein involved in translation (DUF1610 family)